MGVINNLIEIRRKFRAIVGANWDGTTLGKLLELYSYPIIIEQPSNTDGTPVRIGTDTLGYYAVLQRKLNDGTWITVNVRSISATSGSVTVSDIVETSTCRILVVPYGAKNNIGTYSNEFTVTRTEAQTTSAMPKSKGADIFTESEADSIDVVKENIEKE